MRKAAFIVAIVLVAGQRSPANAEFITGLINLDFKLDSNVPPQAGAALFGAAGDEWNVQSAQANGSSAHTTDVLVLANGTASDGVTLSLSDVSNIFAGGPSGFDATPYKNLMADGYIENTGKTFSMTFNGLTAFQPYDLYFYSFFPDSIVHTTTFTIAGISRTVVNTDRLSTFVEGINYSHFKSQFADANGHLVITMQGSGGAGVGSAGGIINGFQIAPVSEPATLTLAAVGLASLLGARSLYRRA